VTNSADLRQEQAADYRIFELAGDHYTIGYQMGLVTDLRPVETWRDREVELAFARACADVVGQFHPALLDEFRGYAAAQDRPWDEVLPHFSNNLPEGSLGGCTTVVQRLPDGHVLVARNHDFLYTRKERYLRRLSPIGYRSSLGTQSGFIGSCYDGVNGDGLFVALHTVRVRLAQAVPPGVPAFLIPRILLETCGSAREAVLLAQRIPHLFPFSYLIADVEEMAVVEAYPGQVQVRRPRPGQGAIVATNLFESPGMRALHGRRNLTGPVQRVRWLEERLAEDQVENARSGWTWAQRILRDHSVPICHHQPNQATFWSLVADLSARRIVYCLGAPCRNQFQEWEWPADRPPGV
jgi:predicted choloylglycine hydrolase